MAQDMVKYTFPKYMLRQLIMRATRSTMTVRVWTWKMRENMEHAKNNMILSTIILNFKTPLSPIIYYSIQKGQSLLRESDKS